MRIYASIIFEISCLQNVAVKSIMTGTYTSKNGTAKCLS